MEPELHEDIFGYLTRVANDNHHGGLGAILSEVLGVKQQASISYADLPNLAYYCRLHIDEIVRLSGISRRLPEGTWAWQVCDKWVTKESFISTRRGKVCPACLQDRVYVRGLWLLNFYTVCAYHGTTLIEVCPACGRKIQWNRRSTRCCMCGFDFASAATKAGSHNSIMISKLIAFKCDYDIALLPSVDIKQVEYEHLAALSLDGFCKTIWFLGHCLGELGSYSTGHGRIKPMAAYADAIIEKALNIMRDWPNQLGERLRASKQRKLSAGSGTLLEKMLGPVHNYFQQELQDEEFAFVRTAYEQHLRNFRRTFEKYPQAKVHDRQLEFDFGS